MVAHDAEDDRQPQTGPLTHFFRGVERVEEKSVKVASALARASPRAGKMVSTMAVGRAVRSVSNRDRFGMRRRRSVGPSSSLRGTVWTSSVVTMAPSQSCSRARPLLSALP